MSALLLWILGVLGLLILLWGLTRLQKGGLAWMGLGLLLGLAGLGGAWLHQQYGTLVFWGLGMLVFFCWSGPCSTSGAAWLAGQPLWPCCWR